MNNKEILDIIYNSSKNNWKRSGDLSRDNFEYKVNPILKIIEKESKTFTKSWATKFPDPNSRIYLYEIIFDEKIINTIELISLDGARAMLPKPSLGSNKINKYEYRIANIIHNEGENKRYLLKCGFELEE